MSVFDTQSFIRGIDVLPERPTVERRILEALQANTPRIPVLLGGCGSGKTTLLQRTSALLGDGQSQYVDTERITSTPEGLLTSLTEDSPYPHGQSEHDLIHASHQTPRNAFNALLGFLRQDTRAPSNRPIFLFDEALALRTLESFPGLRGVLREFLTGLSTSHNRFVISSRYVNRTLRLIRDLPDKFEVIHVSPLSHDETSAVLNHHGIGSDAHETGDLPRIFHALSDGRATYVSSLARSLGSTGGVSGRDPVSALVSLLTRGGSIYWTCQFSYELRLHHARGYGALKAILSILADEEPLTLTKVSQRVGRTPGSTKDYLSWLEDVDLITVRQKRYSFSDPIMRLWVRMYCRSSPPTEAEVATEVQEYAVQRLPFVESPIENNQAIITNPSDESEQSSWGLLEID